MGQRLDIERQKKLEPVRIQYAIDQLTARGYEIIFRDETEIRFMHQGEEIIFFPYSGWHSGKSIKDGRGLQKLLGQLHSPKKNI